ncbi:MAG: NAD(P)-dependent oxidoreductase [Bacteroidales bacterium]
MKAIAVDPLNISTGQYQSIQKELYEAGHDFYMYPDRNENSDAIVERAKDADIMIISNIPVTKKMLDNLPNLKLLNVAFTGVDHIALDACRQKGINVCNAAGYSTIAVSELTIGLTIDVLRKITSLEKHTRHQQGREGFLGREIAGKTAGIIGTGAIGSRTAYILKAMGAKVIAYSRTEKKELINTGIEYVSMEKLLQDSDIISLHLPSTKETHHLISEKQLSIMKDSSVLINTARGPIVDYNALSNALKEGTISGAGIDVYEKEPPIDPEHSLLKAPNTVLVPHIAYATHEAMALRADIVKNNIIQYAKGSPQNIIT